MGYSRQEYYSGLSFPSPRVLPHLGIKPMSLALAGGFFTTEPPVTPTPRVPRLSHFRGEVSERNSDLGKRVKDSCKKDSKEWLPSSRHASFTAPCQTWRTVLRSSREEGDNQTAQWDLDSLLCLEDGTLSWMFWEWKRKTECRTWLDTETVFSKLYVSDGDHCAYPPQHLKWGICQSEQRLFLWAAYKWGST